MTEGSGRRLASDDVAAAFLAAARAELTALKPGNVHVHAGGHHMEVAQFEAAATAAAPFVAATGRPVGARIRDAVAASMAAAGCNTNLGILLLTVPLAKSCEHRGPSPRSRLRSVLAALDGSDAAAIYDAIRRANPGGLGRTSEADVAAPPSIPIMEAMRLAAPRDRIAANYVSGFADLFEDHLPRLTRLRASAADATPPVAPDDVVATLYMTLLARFPDSHIRRKFGLETAAHVQKLAASERSAFEPHVSPETHPRLLRLDATLKASGWNPGTTADFVVATLFAADLEPSSAH